MTATIILASASQARKAMLASAGISFSVERPTVDESLIKQRLKSNGADAAAVAQALALEKALDVSRRHRQALAIGSDQMLVCDGRWFDKPNDRSEAKAQLKALRGRRHELISAVAVVSNEKCLWHHVERAELSMRAFSDAFLDEYLDRVGGDALQSVGAYQIEGLGAQLFETIRGDHFTIMGMPLLPLLDFLRSRDAVTP